MVLVPAGEFPMGSEQGDDDEQPVHRVFLDSFYLDTFEVTNGQFAKFVAAILSEPPWGFADQETPVLHAERPVRGFRAVLVGLGLPMASFLYFAVRYLLAVERWLSR